MSLPGVNKFEQVSGLDHQISVGVGWGWGPPSHAWRSESGPGKGSCTVRSKASWVMVTWDPFPVDRQTRMKILSTHNFVSGRKKFYW